MSRVEGGGSAQRASVVPGPLKARAPFQTCELNEIELCFLELMMGRVGSGGSAQRT